MPSSNFRSDRRQAGRGALLAFVSVVVAVVGLAAIDRLAGFVVPASWTARSVLFPPNVQFTMKTPEFTCDVRTNELGFRGGYVTPEPSPERVRIVAIGDSFTYGWGVGEREAWPARLESRLRQQDIAADVLNLGSPGAGPNEYADVAERALPALKPSVVIVGLLQGEDLLQSAGTSAPSSPSAFSGLASKLYPTFTSVVQSARQRSRSADTSADVLAAMEQPFRDGAREALASFTPEEKKRYDALEPRVRAMFEAGEINPALVALAIRRPGYFMEAIEKEPAELAPESSAMLAALRRIQAAADKVGARTIAVGIPYPFYVNRPAQNRLVRLGFRGDRSALRSLRPLPLVEEQIEAAGFDRLRIRDEVRELRGGGAWRRPTTKFFPWDNHFNAEGHQWFADRIAPDVAAEIRQSRAGTTPSAK